jgi:hypothetical protein
LSSVDGYDAVVSTYTPTPVVGVNMTLAEHKVANPYRSKSFPKELLRLSVGRNTVVQPQHIDLGRLPAFVKRRALAAWREYKLFANKRRYSAEESQAARFVLASTSVVPRAHLRALGLDCWAPDPALEGRTFDEFFEERGHLVNPFHGVRFLDRDGEFNSIQELLAHVHAPGLVTW